MMPCTYNAAIVEKLRGQLYRIAARKRSSKQIGEIAGLLSSAFSQVDLRPVLVGGAAVELYKVRSRYGVFHVISREDLAVDRLNSFAYWGSTVDGLNVLLLMMQDEFSNARFRSKLKGTELVPLAAKFTRLRRSLEAGKRTFDGAAASLLHIIHDWNRSKP
jgi:hypothetical protein